MLQTGCFVANPRFSTRLVHDYEDSRCRELVSKVSESEDISGGGITEIPRRSWESRIPRLTRRCLWVSRQVQNNFGCKDSECKDKAMGPPPYPGPRKQLRPYSERSYGVAPPYPGPRSLGPPRPYIRNFSVCLSKYVAIVEKHQEHEQDLGYEDSCVACGSDRHLVDFCFCFGFGNEHSFFFAHRAARTL